MARKSTKTAVERFLSSKEEKEPLAFKDKRQVDLDLQRVALSKAAKAKLEHRVGTVLAANKELSYYQGFHDIAMHSHSTRQLENLALQQLRDFMAASMLPTQQILALVPELLHTADKTGVGRYFAPQTSGDNRALLGYFAVAPIVTLFSHHTDDSQVILPIIRSVLKEGLAYVLYLYAALIIENPQLFQRVRQSTRDDGAKEHEGAVEVSLEDISPDEIDMALSGAGSLLTSENFAAVDRRAHQLRSKHPLKKLPAWKSVSRHSVLKTGKVTNRNTALYLLRQLDREESGNLSLTTRASSRLAMMALAVGAVAVGMFLSRSHR